jgi:hypothetical protein
MSVEFQGLSVSEFLLAEKVREHYRGENAIPKTEEIFRSVRTGIYPVKTRDQISRQ